jgi:ectoine hydroxylase-related dioxygenase (phytanoyl-CoA dioxygenase family)
MELTTLTDEQQTFFDENGYLIVRNALDGEMIERLTKAGDRFMATTDPPHNYYANRYIDLTIDESLMALTTNPRILPLVVQLLSYDIYMMRGNIIYKYPQPESPEPLYPDGDGRSFRNWHRDLNNFASNSPIRGNVAIRVGYCLTDFSEMNSGVTMLVPGSHKVTKPLQFKKGSYDPPEFIEPSLNAGDAYLFSTCTYHMPSVNFTNHVAKGLLISYCYRWWAQTAERPPDEVLDKMDPITAQLFYGQFEGDDIPLKQWAKAQGLPHEEPPMRVFV